MVAGPRSFVVDLLLCPLRIRKYYRSCDCDVRAVFDSYPCRRCSTLCSDSVAGILFQPRRCSHSLRYNCITDLLWCWLRVAANVVVHWADRLVSNDCGLDDRRFRVVEGFETLVKRNTNIDLHKLETDVQRQFNSITEPTTLSIRLLRREISKRIAELPANKVVRLAINLIESATTPRFFAYELVQHHPAALKSLNSRTIQKLGAGMESWNVVDAFACFLAGPVWREHQIPDSLISAWAHSKDRWWRRAAVVSTVPLNNKTRGGRGDSPRTMQICEMVVDDRDDMVVKALSWSLRELAKRDHLSVRGFLAEHEARLAPRVLREVRNKLNTGLKNPHR